MRTADDILGGKELGTMVTRGGASIAGESDKEGGTGYNIYNLVDWRQEIKAPILLAWFWNIFDQLFGNV